MRLSVRSLLPLLALGAALGHPADPAAAAGRYDWPLHPDPEVTAPFDPPPQRWQPGHRGVDLGASEGQPVLAAGDGIVAFAGEVAGKPVVSIDHGTVRTTYEPVVASVSAGQAVHVGSPIGTVAAGHSGCPVVACLHWGARRGAVYLDPLSLLEPRVVRLLPL